MSSSHFAPRLMGDGTRIASAGARTNGAALSRPLEFSARRKRRAVLTQLPNGRGDSRAAVLGQGCGYPGELFAAVRPGDRCAFGELLAERQHRRSQRDTVHQGLARRSSWAPEVTSRIRSSAACSTRVGESPHSSRGGWALLGPRGQDASGIIAGMRVGANLAGMQQNLSYGSTFHIPGNLATRDPYTDMLPGHPTFSLRGSTGHQAWQRFLPAPDRSESGGAEILQ